VRFLVDTNIFLHAANSGSPHYSRARSFLQQHLQARTAWVTTWPILYEFLRVATHARVFPKPLKPKQAIAFVQQFVECDEVRILAATDRHAEILAAVTTELTHPTGNLFHDIHTAVLMREHGVQEIVTADTDFLQFRGLRVNNPL
jgi:toxin-antitoxin system PIN domain toxin